MGPVEGETGPYYLLARKWGPADPRPEPTAEQRRRVDALVGELSRATFKTREAAMLELVKIGKVILPALREKLAHKRDPEVVNRLRVAIRRIDPLPLWWNGK